MLHLFGIGKKKKSYHALKLYHGIDFLLPGHSSIVHEFEFILDERPIPWLYEAT